MSALPKHLLDILACPCPHHAPVQPDDPIATTALICTRCATRFAVDDGVPNMILQDAIAGPHGVGGQAAP